MASQLIDSLDSSGTGSLSLSDIESALGGSSSSTASSSSDPALAAQFAKLDANGDGQLSASELESALQSNAPQPPPLPPSASASGIAGELIGAFGDNGQISLSQVETALDGSSSSSSSSSSTSSTSSTSSDSTLSAAFAKIDTNGDGELSADELTSAIQSFMTSQASFSPQDIGWMAAATSVTA